MFLEKTNARMERPAGKSWDPSETCPYPSNDRGLPAVAWPILLGLAAARLALHLFIGSGYGFHQDEFYYLACGMRPDWGYVDQPPLVPLLSRLAAAIWGYTAITPGELRVFSASGAAGTILLAGLITRELGGGRFAQGLAALAVWCAPLFLAAGEMFQTVVFDQFFWALSIWLLLRTWRRGPGAGWLLVGLVAGIGLEVKNTMGLFGLGLAATLVCTAAGRRHLRTPWPWLGGLLAVVLLAPNLWWQHTHGWPTAEFVHNNNARNRVGWTGWGFALDQLKFLAPGGFLLAMIGLRRVFSKAAPDGARVTGWIYLVSLAVLLATRGKPYYLGPAYPALIAAGAVATEAWIARRQEQGTARSLRPAIVAGILLTALPIAPAVLPLIPRERLAGSWALKLNHEQAEMIGWPELAAQVDGVCRSLPPQELTQTTVLTVSYNCAGAIEHYGHLPPALMPPVSIHNSYWLWGPGATEPQTVIIVGARHREWMEKAFEQVELAAVIDNSLHLDNENRGAGIYVCRRPRKPIRDWWQEWKNFG